MPEGSLSYNISPERGCLFLSGDSYVGHLYPPSIYTTIYIKWLMVFGTGKTHAKGKNGETVVMQLGNGQYIVTLPKHVAVWKGIRKGTTIRWIDGGPGRIVLEVIQGLGG